jgi:hypothetical protein
VMSLYLPSVQMRKDYDTIHVYGWFSKLYYWLKRFQI